MNLLQKIALRYSHYAMNHALEKNFVVKLNSCGAEKIPKARRKYMLYLHIPFCHTFCSYCSFHKYAYDEEIAKIYFNNLREEIKQLKTKGFEFETLYVGGGTALINELELLETLKLCKNLFQIREISCETDPNHIQPDQLGLFKGIIDRLSCGVQSFDDLILKRVARYDKFGSSTELQSKIKQANGILPILSLDLIFNFPSQNFSQLKKDIEIAKSLDPQQLTFYPLMKSNLTKSKITKSLGDTKQDQEYEFFKLINQSLADYQKNNAWSFSQKQSHLNDEYVSSNYEYVGAGSGAFSFLDGKLLINAFNLEDYSRLICKHQNANIAEITFNTKEIIKYVFLTHLFSGKLEIAQFDKLLDCNLKKILWLELLGLKLSGAIIEKDGWLYTSEFGQYLFLVLMKNFYTGMDLVRAVFRNDEWIKNRSSFNLISEGQDIAQS